MTFNNMYKCKCGNTIDFKEVYRVETIVQINNGEPINSYDRQNDLLEVLCLMCNDSSEDGSILDSETLEKILIN